MLIKLPILHQEIVDGKLHNTEKLENFELDTSVYSEERWEQHFPLQAKRESLFQYVERVRQDAINDRVKVISMLKAIFCFIESDAIPSYKKFAQMFILSEEEYTTKLLTQLKSAFELVLGSSSVKN